MWQFLTKLSKLLLYNPATVLLLPGSLAGVYPALWVDRTACMTLVSRVVLKQVSTSRSSSRSSDGRPVRYTDGVPPIEYGKASAESLGRPLGG